MNWYIDLKLSSTSLLDPTKQHENIKNYKLFNYLKSQNITLLMYHGTTQKSYLECLKSGYLLSSNLAKIKNPLTPEQSRNYVFLTPSKSYAQQYAKQMASNSKDIPVIMTFKVPIYVLNEVRNSILDTNFQDRFSDALPVYENVDKTIENNDRTTGDGSFNTDILYNPDKFINEIFNRVKSGLIFTTYLALSMDKFFKSIEIVKESFNKNMNL